MLLLVSLVRIALQSLEGADEVGLELCPSKAEIEAFLQGARGSLRNGHRFAAESRARTQVFPDLNTNSREAFEAYRTPHQLGV